MGDDGAPPVRQAIQRFLAKLVAAAGLHRMAGAADVEELTEHSAHFVAAVVL